MTPFYRSDWFREAGRLSPEDRLRFWDALHAWAADGRIETPRGPARAVFAAAVTLLQAGELHAREVSAKRAAAGRAGARVTNAALPARKAKAAANAGPAIAENPLPGGPSDAGAANAGSPPAGETPEPLVILPSVPPVPLPGAADAGAANAAFPAAPRNTNIYEPFPLPKRSLPGGTFIQPMPGTFSKDEDPVLPTRPCSGTESGSKDARARELPVITLPLNDGSGYGVTRHDVERYEAWYPAVDVLQELRNMAGWCDANPKKRKTRSGIRKFINHWLANAQDRGGSRSFSPSPAGSTNPYRQFVKGDIFHDL